MNPNAYTLVANRGESIFTQGLWDVQTATATDAVLSFAAPGLKKPKIAAWISPEVNDRQDLRAYGIRDQVPFPPQPHFNRYRNNLYDPNDQDAPVPDWNNETPTFRLSNFNRAHGSETWRLLAETPVREHWSKVERGTFSVPYTGFSRLADITPHSTMEWI